MRFFTLFAASVLLIGCTTAPSASPASTPTSTTASAAPSSSPIARLLASGGGPNAATRAAIERALGAPDIARQDGAGAALTYRLQTCALLLVFEADQRNELRLARTHASSRRPGEAAPNLDQCAAEAAAR